MANIQNFKLSNIADNVSLYEIRWVNFSFGYQILRCDLEKL